MTPKQYLIGVSVSGLIGGTINGSIALYYGRSFLTGNDISPTSFLPFTKPSFKIDNPESRLNTEGLLSPIENSYGAWWGQGHLQNAYRYNQAWGQFIKYNPNASQQEIFNFAIQLKLQFKY